MERRLAAILAADVAGYTALMGADESGTLRRLTDLRRDFLEPLIDEHRGRVVKLMGDGLLVEFSSIVDAVTCALAWQHGVAEKEATAEKDMRLQFRIGINLGDVIVEGDDIHGDGVNIAARLEGLAEPGGICLSDDAYRQARGKVEASFEDLGERDLKNVSEPVRVYRVAGDSSGTASTASGRTALPLPDKPSIAVLPFTNMSGDTEQDYFSDGITEDIITELSRFSSLFVIARNSSFIYKGKAVDVTEVGRSLGVQYVIEGSVRKAGDRVRVTAQLVEAHSGRHVWAQRYDRDLRDIFELQDEVSKVIVGTIAGRVDAAEAQRVAWKPPDDMTAHDRFLRGLQEFRRQEREPLANARELFEEAIDLDPGYARAHAYLAFTHVSDVWYGYSDLECLQGALDTVEKAINLDADDTFAQAVHGLVLFFLGREEEGISKLKRSIELNGNDAEVLHWLGFILPFVRRASEGVDYIREAIRLNPFNIDYDNALGIALYHDGQFEEAAEVLQKYADTEWRFTISYLAAAHAQLGRIEEAEAEAREAVALRKQELRDRGYPIPDSSLALICEEWERARWPAAMERLFDGLRKIGLS